MLTFKKIQTFNKTDSLMFIISSANCLSTILTYNLNSNVQEYIQIDFFYNNISNITFNC